MDGYCTCKLCHVKEMTIGLVQRDDFTQSFPVLNSTCLARIEHRFLWGDTTVLIPVIGPGLMFQDCLKDRARIPSFEFSPVFLPCMLKFAAKVSGASVQQSAEIRRNSGNAGQDNCSKAKSYKNTGALPFSPSPS